MNNNCVTYFTQTFIEQSGGRSTIEMKVGRIKMKDSKGYLKHWTA